MVISATFVPPVAVGDGLPTGGGVPVKLVAVVNTTFVPAMYVPGRSSVLTETLLTIVVGVRIVIAMAGM